MPLEDILRKIEEEAELKKKRILEEARTRASAQLERAQKELKEEADRLLAERRKEVELEVQRRLAQARLAGKNEVGKVKHQAWEKLQESLVAAFVEKIETEGREWCKEFLIQYVVSGDEEVWMAPQEAEIWGSGFVKEINEEKNLSLRFGGIAEDIERGFLLRRGGMMVDLSFVSVVEEYIRENERRISALLFEG